MSKLLRDYQIEALKPIFYEDKGIPKQALIVLATGLGKTVVAAALVWVFMNMSKQRNNTRVLFLCHMHEALEQLATEMMSRFSEGPDITMGTYRSGHPHADVNVLFSTFQTMRNHLDEFDPDEFEIIIVDEAHHGQAKTFKEVITHFSPRLLTGFTATPNRGDGLDIRDLFGEEVYTYDLAQALAEGKWLAKVDYRLVTDNISIKALQKLVRQETGTRLRVSREMIDGKIFLPERLEAIGAEVQRVQQEEGLTQTILFCRNKRHLEKVAEQFPHAKAYHSDLHKDVLQSRLEAFRAGALQEILVINKFNEALDLPTADLLVFLRGTESDTIWKQQLGRGLRGEHVVVLDFVGNCNRIRQIQAFESVHQDHMVRLGITVATGWQITMTQEVVDIMSLLDRDFYPTWEEAAEATHGLNIRSSTEYKHRYKVDPRLPRHPETSYSTVWKQNGGWYGFLGGEIKNFYPTWKEALIAARRLHIESVTEYKQRYKEDPRLPSSPGRVYEDVWKKNGGWPGFLRKKVFDPYPTWNEATKATQELGISSQGEYKQRYKEDPRLPSNPNNMYNDVWKQNGGFPGFFGKETKKFYTTWEEAAQAARRIARSSYEYKQNYKEDPRLPSRPSDLYKNVWKQNGGWSGFLGKRRGEGNDVSK